MQNRLCLLLTFDGDERGKCTISLSTLGDTEGDSETDDCYEHVNDMGDKFKKRARIYGLTPSVTFSPNDEVIGE